MSFNTGITKIPPQEGEDCTAYEHSVKVTYSDQLCRTRIVLHLTQMYQLLRKPSKVSVSANTLTVHRQ